MILVSLVALAACTGAQATISPSPAPTPGQCPTRFASARYGYSIQPPAGWICTPALLTWDGSGVPRTTSPLVDVFAGPETEGVGKASGMAIGPQVPELTLDAWKSHNTEAMKAEPCSPAEREDLITVAGDPGVLRFYHCSHFLHDDIFAMQALAVHDSSATYVIWTNWAGSEDVDLATFHAIVASIRYGP